MANKKHWFWLLLALITLVIRFIYGRKYEIVDDQFRISSIGIFLVILGLIFFGVFLYFDVRKKNQERFRRVVTTCSS